MMDWGEIAGVIQTVWKVLCPFVEIGILAFLIYEVLYFLRGSRGVYVLTGLSVALIGMSFLAEWLNFEVISRLISESGVVLAVAIIVIFQPELRRAFAQLGSYTFLRGKRRREIISEVVAAAMDMSRRKCGALIVLERRIGMRALEEDAVRLDIKVNALVLESIFYPNSPLHDGAVIIRDNRIVAARVILPLTRNGEMLSKRLGTRHRAALGVSEETDAVVVVVSEETGIISICAGGVLRRDLPPEQLENYLSELMGQTRTESTALPVFMMEEKNTTEDFR
ncbi:MAG: diadenylate cyclase CdaA [Lentisphaeria bacterium]|nr:diadenylate cyclase CdaA [Lentisphaeria bacterium]